MTKGKQYLHTFEVTYLDYGYHDVVEIEARDFETFIVGSCLSALFFDDFKEPCYAYKDIICIKRIKEAQTDD